MSLVLSLGCASEPASSSEVETADLDALATSGKLDGLLDVAPELALGREVRGEITEGQLDVYRLELRENDRFDLVMTPRGTLDPDMSLFFGTSTGVRSSALSHEGAALKKSYRATSAGTYALAVRAFHGRGVGSYTIRATCTGGPCAGEHTEPSGRLAIAAAAGCIENARRCSFAKLPELGDAVGAARAQRAFDECLNAGATPEGVSCRSACGTNAEAGELCVDIVRAIPFYADVTAPCITALDSCLDDCQEGEWSWDDDGEFWTTPASICWKTGLNGTCDGYARELRSCGGTLAPDSKEACLSRCQSTTGAWIDDLDTLCDEECE